MSTKCSWISTAPLVIAHRGASAYAPENTLAAFTRAIELGADAIELDVKITKDGVVAVLHDTTLDRTTNGTGYLKQYNYDEIYQLDAGSAFSSSFARERVPTLEGVLQELGQEILFNIELTNYDSIWSDLPERVIKIVEDLNLEERVLLSSFNPIALNKSRRRNRAIRRALILHDREPRLVQLLFARLLYFDFLHLHQSLVDDEKLSKKHKVNVWTVNDESRMKELLATGITGIITDAPDVAIDVRDEFVSSSC